MLCEQNGEIDAAGVAIIVDERVQCTGSNACNLRKWLFQNGFTIDSKLRLSRAELLEQQFFKPFELFPTRFVVISIQCVGGDFREGASIMGTWQLE